MESTETPKTRRELELEAKNRKLEVTVRDQQQTIYDLNKKLAHLRDEKNKTRPGKKIAMPYLGRMV